MESKAIISTLDLIMKNDNEVFKNVFNYQITENCLLIFISNGSIRKCQKFKLLQEMEFKETSFKEYIAKVDIGMICD